jgi:hypothetical protein
LDNALDQTEFLFNCPLPLILFRVEVVVPTLATLLGSPEKTMVRTAEYLFRYLIPFAVIPGGPKIKLELLYDAFQ